MHTFDFTDILLFLGISQGIFLAITLALVNNRNKSANKILSYLLIIACVMLVGRIFYPKYKGVLFLRVAAFVDTLIFLFGPILYLYIRRLAFYEVPAYKIAWLHFIPAILHTLFFAGTLFYTTSELLILGSQGKLNFIYFVVETTGLLSNLIYTYASFRLVKLYEVEEKNNLSYSQRVHRYLQILLLGISVFLLLWILSYFNTNFIRKRELLFISYHLIWISVPIFIYIIGFFSLKQPEIFRVPIIKNKKIKRERLEGEELNTIKKNLEYLMVEKKIYLNNELTLKQLSEELNTSTNNVSWLLNNIHKCSFYDYINTYRVQEFITKIKRGEHHQHTILALSLDSGFNSKSTFNKAFKMIKKETPSNYIRRLKVS